MSQTPVHPSNEVLHATLAIDDISVTLLNVITPTFQDTPAANSSSNTITAPPHRPSHNLVRQRCPLTHVSVCFERVGKKGSRRSTRWASTLYPQVGDDLDEGVVAPHIAATKDRVLYFGTMSTMYFPIQVKAESQSALNAAYAAASRERGRTNHSLARLNSSLMTSAASTFNATTTTATPSSSEGVTVASKSKHPLVCTIRCFDVEKAKLDFEAAESSYFQPRKPFYNAKVSEVTTGIEVDIAACINNALLKKKLNDDGDSSNGLGGGGTLVEDGSNSSSPATANSSSKNDRYVVNNDGSITYTVHIVFAPSALVTISNSSIHGPITIKLQFTARCEQLATDDDVTKEAASVEAIIKKIKKMSVLPSSSSMSGSTNNNNIGGSTNSGEFTKRQIIAAKQLEDVLHDGDTGADEEPLTGLKGANPPTLFSLRMYNTRRHATISLEKETVGGRGGGRSSVGGQSSDVVFPHYEEPVNLLDPTNGTRCIATNESFMTAANSSVSNSVAASMDRFRSNQQDDAFAEGIPGGSDQIDNNNNDDEEYGANAGNYDNGDVTGGPSSLTGLVQYIHPSTMARAAAAAASSSGATSPSTPTPLVPSFSRNRHNAHSYHDYCIVLDSIILNTSMVSTTTTSVPSHTGGGGLGRVHSYGMGFFADTTSGTPANHPSFVCPKLLEPDSKGLMCFAPAEGSSIVSFHDEAKSSSPNTPTDEPLKSPSSVVAADDDVNNHKSWCIFSCRSASYSNLAVGRREIVTSRFKTVGDADDDCVSPISASTLLAKSVVAAPSATSPNRSGGGGRGSKPLLHTPAISVPATISNTPEKGLCKSSQRAKLVFCLVRVSRDEGGVLRPCSEASSFQALDLAAEVLNVENYPHDGETFRVRFNYGEILQFRLRRRCFRAPLVHLSALLVPPPPLSKSKGTRASGDGARSPSHMSPNFVSPANGDVVGSGSSTSTTTTSPTGQEGGKKIVKNNNNSSSIVPPTAVVDVVSSDNCTTTNQNHHQVGGEKIEGEDANMPDTTQSLPTSNTRLYSPQAQ